MAADPLASHYAVLTASERLRLVLEAMARRDGTQAGQLKDTCPRRTYSAPDVAFAERYALALDAATVACAEMQGLYGSLRALDWAIRTVASCSALHDLNAEIAFLEGVVAAVGEQAGPTDEEVAPALFAVAERSQASAAAIVALLTRGARDTARELSVVWAAFGRFARSRLCVTGEALLAAGGLPAGDQIKQMITTYAPAPPDPARVAEYEALLAERWDRRLGEGDTHHV
jgi:hypothetical protein